MDMPPTRFRVVERGRRLEVIDTATGQPITRHTPDPTMSQDTRASPAATPPAPTRSLPRASSAALVDRLRASRLDSATPWTTRAFYDDKGPRLLTPHPTRVAVARALPVAVVIGALLIGVVAITAPILLAGLWVLGNATIRGRLRQRSTALLDWLERPA